MAYGREHGYNGEGIYIRHEAVAAAIDGIIEQKGFKTILDVGSGLGIMDQFIRHDVTLRGIDQNEKEVALANEIAKKNGRNFTYEVGDVYHIPNETKYDIIVISEVLEHVPEDGGLLQMLREKYLAPGGVIVASVPNWMRLGNRALKRRRQPLKILDETHMREYTLEQIRWVFEHYGFTVLDERFAVLYFFHENFWSKLFPKNGAVRGWLLRLFPSWASHFIYVVQ